MDGTASAPTATRVSSVRLLFNDALTVNEFVITVASAKPIRRPKDSMGLENPVVTAVLPWTQIFLSYSIRETTAKLQQCMCNHVHSQTTAKMMVCAKIILSSHVSALTATRENNAKPSSRRFLARIRDSAGTVEHVPMIPSTLVNVRTDTLEINVSLRKR
jgi:hypothetical protein